VRGTVAKRLRLMGGGTNKRLYKAYKRAYKRWRKEGGKGPLSPPTTQRSKTND